MCESPRAWVLVAGCLLGILWPRSAFAFSDPANYADAVELGGGGGRWFTGTPADGYGCDVCHRGGEPAPLTVTGLPLAGYRPGATYEITMGWPVGVEHVVLLAEITDEERRAAGTLEIPPFDRMTQAERCSAELGGVPAASLSESGDGRTFVSVVDCGAQVLRFRWTAPTTDVGTVWLGAGLVTSDVNADALGDGVTMVRRPMTTGSLGLGSTSLAQGCALAGPLGAHGAAGSGALAVGLLGLIGCRMRRQRRRGGRSAVLGLAGVAIAAGCAARASETELGETSFRGGFPVMGEYAPIEGSADTALPIPPPGIAPTQAPTGAAGAPAPTSPLPGTGDPVPPVETAGVGGSEPLPAPGTATTDPAAPAASGAPGTLTLSFTTVNVGGRYQPRNVGAVWIENGTGAFVKTLARWAGVRAVHLSKWNAASGGWSSFFGFGATPDELDAVTSATLRTAEAHNLTWDMADNNGAIVPDGKYTVKIEVADDNIRASSVAAIPFDKSTTPVQLHPADQSPYTGLSLSYQP